ncbi:MAG: hypothetical protein EBX40_01935 [Gammaproteobacteria bacterium]|nr:hypothetical protein [Gammaproteobacteria bacterium]
MVLMTAAYLLHRFAYSDSDLILKFFTQEHGLISCIAKQAKRLLKVSTRPAVSISFCLPNSSSNTCRAEWIFLPNTAPILDKI